MHGKIAIYMDSTGRGTVTNSANTFFDFSRQIWNDKKSMPSVGMLVEFRTLSSDKKSENGAPVPVSKTITGIKPSKFQEFKEGDFITEHDFWKTDSDDELEDLQNSRRSAYITELYRSIDFDSIEKFPYLLLFLKPYKNILPMKFYLLKPCKPIYKMKKIFLVFWTISFLRDFYLKLMIL